jgi:hypothetical protein
MIYQPAIDGLFQKGVYIGSKAAGFSNFSRAGKTHEKNAKTSEELFAVNGHRQSIGMQNEWQAWISDLPEA